MLRNDPVRLGKILYDPELPGLQLSSPLSIIVPSSVKIMVYDGDIVCLLTSPAYLDRLQSHF